MTHLTVAFVAIWCALDVASSYEYLPGGTFSLQVARLYAAHPWTRAAFWVGGIAFLVWLDHHFVTYLPD